MALATLEALRDEFCPIVLAPPGAVLAEAERLGFQGFPFRNTTEFTLALWRCVAQYEKIAFAATRMMHSLSFLSISAFCRRHAVHLHVVHGGEDERECYERKKILNGTNVTFVAVSDYVRARLVAYGTNPKQICVIDNFLLDRFISSTPKRPLFAAGGIRKIIVVSRLEPIKRLDLLLDALDRCPEIRDLSFRIYGTGSELRSLQARAQASHANVVFEGFSNSIPEKLAESDLLLHLCPIEPFGLVVLEAIAARVPVLVPDQGGSSTLISPGVSGFHFRADDVDSLAGALLHLKQMPATLLNATVAAANSGLESNYSGTVGGNKYRHLLGALN